MYSPVKKYINETVKIKVSETAIKKLISTVNSTTKKIIKAAQAAAKKKKRKTISLTHITEAIEKNIGKKTLTWQETTAEIIKKNPTDLGKISRAINDHISKGKK